MIKISAGIAYEQNRPRGVASALIEQFVFLVKWALEMRFTKYFFPTKVATNHITQLLMQKIYGSLQGLGICPDGTIRFFGNKCLKDAFYKHLYQTKVVTNQNSELLC